MSITRVQGANGHNLDGSTATTSTSAFASPVTAGNHIIVGIAQEGPSTSVVDTFSNNYKLVIRQKSPSSNNRVEIWIAEAVQGGASNVVTGNQGFADGAIFAEEWSGLAPLYSYDVSGGAGSTPGPTTLDTGALSTTRTANELVFVVAEQDLSGTVNLSVGAGYSNFTTDRSNFVVGAIESQVLSAQASINGIMTTDSSANSWVIAAATFAATQRRPSIQVNHLRPHAFSPGLAR